jgi:hypothetical protein
MGNSGGRPRNAEETRPTGGRGPFGITVSTALRVDLKPGDS